MREAGAVFEPFYWKTTLVRFVTIGVIEFSKSEVESFFELFYREAAPLYAVSIDITGVSKSSKKDILLKNGKSLHKKFIQIHFLDTGFLINLISSLFLAILQISTVNPLDLSRF